MSKMVAPTLYFQTKLTLQGSWTTCVVRLNNPTGHDDVLALWQLPHECAIVEAMWIPVCTLMQILDPDLEADSCLGDGLHLHGLIVSHAIDRTVVLLGSSTPGTVQGRRLRPKHLDTTGSLQLQTAGEPYTPYRISPNHSWLKRRSEASKPLFVFW
jgi:hypothetical protein